MRFDQITKVKKYFLCLSLFVSTNSFTMDIINDHVKKICDIIDNQHLNINKHQCFKSVTGAFLSYYTTLYMPAETAKKEIKMIENHLLNKNINDKKTIFKQLVEKHWYIYYLIQILVDAKIKKFENVTGSTIDQLLYPDFSKDVTGKKEMIHHKAYHQFFLAHHITGRAVKIPENYDAATQFMILYGDTSPINHISIMKSSDDRYVRAYDRTSNTLIWSTRNGKRVTLSDQENNALQWQPTHYSPHTGPFPLYWISAQLAIHHDLKLMNLYRFPITIDTQKPALLLYKHPSTSEYLTKKAFAQSLFMIEELNVLLGSKSFIDRDSDFSKEKLQERINNQITSLGTFPRNGTQQG